MRDAALMIANQRDDHTRSFAGRLAAAFARLKAGVLDHLRARRHLVDLDRFDAHRLDDLGLTPQDLVGLDRSLSARAATRHLARLAQNRRDAWRRDIGWRDL